MNVLNPNQAAKMLSELNTALAGVEVLRDHCHGMTKDEIVRYAKIVFEQIQPAQATMNLICEEHMIYGDAQTANSEPGDG